MNVLIAYQIATGPEIKQKNYLQGDLAYHLRRFYEYRTSHFKFHFQRSQGADVKQNLLLFLFKKHSYYLFFGIRAPPVFPKQRKVNETGGITNV